MVSARRSRTRPPVVWHAGRFGVRRRVDALRATVLHRARVAKWQTRWLQVPVPARAWGFKSPLAHSVMTRDIVPRCPGSSLSCDRELRARLDERHPDVFACGLRLASLRGRLSVDPALAGRGGCRRPVSFVQTEVLSQSSRTSPLRNALRDVTRAQSSSPTPLIQSRISSKLAGSVRCCSRHS